MLPLQIKNSCENLLGQTIDHVSSVSGGDINQARLIHTSDGAFFLKYNSSPHAYELLRVEQQGLDLIRKSKHIRVPDCFGLEDTDAGAFLLMEYIPTGRADHSFWLSFAQDLARMHRFGNAQYGLKHDNFIGRLSQHNSPRENAIDFLIEDRLAPQCRLAADQQLLQTKDMQKVEVLFKKLPQLIPSEPPALIHGDLWSGNFMVAENGQAVLIDPAVSFGLREMDLAMSLLFGGFDALFYQAYHEAFPLKGGWRERMDIYQLYYLLAHLNMFGRSYLRSVQQILNKYQ